MERDYIYQIQIRDWIENGLGKELMVPVYGGKKDDKWDIYIQSYLMPISMLEEQIETDTYDVGELVPGITVYGPWESDQKIYHRWNNDKEIEPFVIQRNFNGLAQDSVEIVEEFRLLFNLYFNNQKNEYLDLANNETVVVKIHENGYVCVNKRYLKTYLSVKNMGMIVHVDSRCVNCKNHDILSDDGISYRNAENTVYYNLNIGNCDTGVSRENYSYIFGKKIIFGCELKDCNIWPYNDEKKYIDFIIGVDDSGKEVLYNCNPENLSNYFGANPSAPHYLTPVFFDAAVLNKYYSKPEVYSVEDGIIRCGSLWSFYIDNHNIGYVSAYLGDLGRDLPSDQEQYYWRGFNKIIDGKLSETKYKRDFLAQATNSKSPDFVFKNLYTKVNTIFKNKFGWSIFLPLDEQDIYNFESLRVPINNSIAEMDMLVLSLVKVLLDSINEKDIMKQLTGTYEKLTGSISKLETWFKEKGLCDYQEHIKFLRNLQELRSSGTGHRKGKGYQKISKVFDVKRENYPETFAELLNDSNAFLRYVENNIEKL